MELNKLMKNQSYRRIVKFFHENPTSIDTARGVATWTNQDIKRVRAALKKLSELNLLVSHRVSSTVGYSYTSDNKKISRINRLLKT